MRHHICVVLFASLLARSAVVSTASNTESISFEAPVKVGVAGEPGYCYGFDLDGRGTATKRPTLAAVCGTEEGDVFTSTGGASWSPIAQPEIGKGTINELFHTINGSLRTVQVGRANPDNASWSGTALGYVYEVSRTRGGANTVIRLANNHSTSWTGLPQPSLNGHIRLHQQGAVRVPSSACSSNVRPADDSGCLLQAASVLWGGIDRKRSESLVLFASLNDGISFQYHATIAAAPDYASFPCIPPFPPQIDVDSSREWTHGSCWEGPGNENTLTQLQNGSLIAVLRMKYDAAFTYSLSLDGSGRRWTPLRMLDGIGCCRPRLLQLGSGALILTGGRCTPIGPADNHFWVNYAGDLARWQRISLSAQHNLRAPATMPRYTDGVNCTATNGSRLLRCSAAETLGYTSLLPTGNRTGVVVYNLNSDECGACAYSMRFSVGEAKPRVTRHGAERATEHVSA